MVNIVFLVSMASIHVKVEHGEHGEQVNIEFLVSMASIV